MSSCKFRARTRARDGERQRVISMQPMPPKQERMMTSLTNTCSLVSVRGGLTEGVWIWCKIKPRSHIWIQGDTSTKDYALCSQSYCPEAHKIGRDRNVTN